MSVLKSQQTKSNVEFLRQSRELELLMIRVCDKKAKKHQAFLTQDNHIIVKILPKSFKKARRKLKRLKDKIPYKDIETSYKSWKGNAEKYDNYYQIRKTDEYFNDIYIKDFIKGGNDG